MLIALPAEEKDGSIWYQFGDAMFEWAKDTKQNEHDIVFTLNPEKIEGWNYVQVSVEANGKTEQLWGFQKMVDLDSPT